HELLGFDITQRSYPGALFVAAGGYHHHLGFNIWNSRGISPAPSGMAGLHSFRILVPEKGVWQSVLDKMKPAGRVESMLERGFIARDFDGLTVELYYRS
ncbi:MAG: VOC family protein, partial [Bacteroidota bacterium]